MECGRIVDEEAVKQSALKAGREYRLISAGLNL